MSNTMKFPSISIPKEEWRRTGLMNLTCTCCCGIILLVYLVVMMAQRGSTLNSTTIILDGDCQKAHRANLVLHSFISIISTLILASSRFFMQILSSPSRLEVNRAHLQLRSLEIGISSMKNIRFISRYKAIGWVILLLSSTPIHLLFNSSIFETHFQSSDWRLTVASSSFSTQQVAFFPPGASLTNAGTESITWNSSIIEGSMCKYTEGYGEHVALEDYWDKQSLVYHNITKTASESIFWHNITSHDCQEYYASCKPKNKYRDVVIVVDTKADTLGGWTRSEVFSDPSNILGPIWNSYIPRNDLNSLWYSTQCTTNLPTAMAFSDMGTAYCISSCGRILGHISTSIPTNEIALSESGWIINLHRPSPCSTPNEKRFGYNSSFNSFPVRYCLAEPSPISSCQVGLSNTLLLITTSCVFLKAFICTLVVIYLPHTSLVTLGDALESFISNPDPVTIGLGTFNNYDSHRIQFEQLADTGTESATNLSNTVQPRLWHRGGNRLISIVPRRAWSGTLMPIICFICAGTYYANSIGVFNRVSLQGTIGVSESPFFINGFLQGRGYLNMLLIAGAPQFILSYSFYSYTFLFTRLVAEREFNSYSLAPPKPLRVSYPTGDQVSTYWLQLPYLYSLPLLTASFLLHLLASNSFYIFASNGGYLLDDYNMDSWSPSNKWGMPEGTIILLGFWPLGILIGLLAGLVLAIFPIIYGFCRLPGDMVFGACDSLVLSAACHPHVSSFIPDQDSLYIGEESDNEDDETSHIAKQELLTKLSEGKLRWGVTEVPSDLSTMFDPEQSVMHLSLTSEDAYISKPTDDSLYV